MEKTLEIHLLDLREQIAKEIEEAHENYNCPRVAVSVCSCSMAVRIARGTNERLS
jgi:hypothetical protein